MYLPLYRFIKGTSIGFVYILITLPVHAQMLVLPDPGSTPESPFYFMDLWEEKVRFIFSSRDSLRLQLRQHSTAERLSEANKLAGSGTAGTKRALELFEKELIQLYALSERLGTVSHDNILEISNEYIAILDSISERLPANDKEFAQATKLFLIDTQIGSLRIYAERGSVERTFEIIAGNIENRFERIKKVAIDEQNNNEVFKEYERFIQYGIILIAEYGNERVGTERARTYMEIATRDHERTLTNFVYQRITHKAVLNYEIALNAVRKLHNRTPVVVDKNPSSGKTALIVETGLHTDSVAEALFPPLPSPPTPPSAFE